jgi:hypothetical protein
MAWVLLVVADAHGHVHLMDSCPICFGDTTDLRYGGSCLVPTRGCHLRGYRLANIYIYCAQYSITKLLVAVMCPSLPCFFQSLHRGERFQTGLYDA